MKRRKRTTWNDEALNPSVKATYQRWVTCADMSRPMISDGCLMELEPAPADAGAFRAELVKASALKTRVVPVKMLQRVLTRLHRSAPRVFVDLQSSIGSEPAHGRTGLSSNILVYRVRRRYLGIQQHYVTYLLSRGYTLQAGKPEEMCRLWRGRKIVGAMMPCKVDPTRIITQTHQTPQRRTHAVSTSRTTRHRR